ncbi:MAG: aminodeoxychorismate synthase component I [Candidatus Brocadiaceae bacterium]|nr:aminodeoxychorismate synthase component I [Candidatus Brocadiaceae bacterium]
MDLNKCKPVKTIIHEIKDACPPLEVFARISSKANVFFLDSALPIKGISRYSFLGFNPFLTIKTKRRKIILTDKDGVVVLDKHPFEYLQELLQYFSQKNLSNSIPFQCGLVGYFSYDLCHYIEKLPCTAIDDLGLPDIYMGLYDTIICYDHLLQKCSVIGVDFGLNGNIYDKITHTTEIVERKSPPVKGCKNKKINNNTSPSTPFQFNFTKALYLEAIKHIKDYITAGDVYQVNLSQRIETQIDIPPRNLYLRLREINPAPFSCYLAFDDAAIASSSPERFLHVYNKHVHTRPIKGTRPRGVDLEADEMMKQELLSSTKDDAELTMITDLERNDLGRVCDYGSVKVTTKKELETYPTVHHLVSAVEGNLHERYNFIGLLKATFPGGSITGAPKVRAMQIIDELEPTQRSIYTGAIGYIGFNGNIDLNIAIRTFLIKGKKVYFQVGSGIVADSDEEEEYKETMHKAKALIEALKTVGFSY